MHTQITVTNPQNPMQWRIEETEEIQHDVCGESVSYPIPYMEDQPLTQRRRRLLLATSS
jgi:hypothetical protein